MAGIPRGLRLNNPGNIRRTQDRWQGLAAEQKDPDFFTFVEAKWGYRAMMKILRNYRKKYGCTTVTDFIGRWAPSSENDTAAYIRAVCGRMGVNPTAGIDVNDKGTMCAMAAAMSFVENGREAVREDVDGGWEALGNG